MLILDIIDTNEDQEVKQVGNSEFGARLKKAREDIGLRQSEVCTALEIPKVQTLSAYERGINFPPIETLKKLATYYNVSTDWLLFGKENIVKKEKTQFDYLVQIVEGVDALGLHVGTEEEALAGPFPAIRFSYIALSNVHYPEINGFVKKWADIKRLHEDGTLDDTDYKTLLDKRLSELLKDLKKDPFFEGTPPMDNFVPSIYDEFPPSSGDSNGND